MSPTLTSSHRSALPAGDEPVTAVLKPLAVAPWLAVVTDSVKSIRYGVVQIVVHDSKVVQVECTERTRFEVPQATGRG